MGKTGKYINWKTRTLDEITKDFLAKAKKRLKESTFSRYSFICERHIIPYFNDIELGKVNAKIINKFIQYKLKDGGLSGNPMSPKTVSDIVCLLLQIIRGYSKSGVDTVMDIEKPSYRPSEISIFTEVEYNRLKAYLSIGTDSKKLGIITAMLTGIRIGELCALKWQDIDLVTGIIAIDKTIQRINVAEGKATQKTKIVIDTPKSPASIRKIPIPEILIDKLMKFKSSGNTYLLTNTSSYIEPRIYQRHFKSYLEACDIKDNNFHTLRHTFATRAIEKGVDIKTLSVTLGHSDVSFTMKRYVHPNMEHKRVQIEKIASGF
jgi:integrase